MGFGPRSRQTRLETGARAEYGGDREHGVVFRIRPVGPQYGTEFWALLATSELPVLGI